MSLMEKESLKTVLSSDESIEKKESKKGLLSILDLQAEEIIEILDLAKTLQHSKKELLKGKILASCFYEASTRTRLSFESAMIQLGGSVIGFSDGKTSSSSKGESLSDEIRVIASYVDALVLRHPLEGACKQASLCTSKPIINAGDGANQHPSQTLLDLFTIRECREEICGKENALKDLRIALVGDLKYGRTVHSLVEALSHFSPRIYFVSPPQLEIPEYLCDGLRRKGIKFSYHTDLNQVLPKVDIVYMTRVQEERFLEKTESSFQGLSKEDQRIILKPSMLAQAKKHLKILHPLPRLKELPKAIDAMDQAAYFQQAENGLCVRKAILVKILGESSKQR